MGEDWRMDGRKDERAQGVRRVQMRMDVSKTGRKKGGSGGWKERRKEERAQGIKERPEDIGRKEEKEEKETRKE